MNYSTVPSMKEGYSSQLPFGIINDSMTSPSFKAGDPASAAGEDTEPDRVHAGQFARYKSLSSGGGTVVGFEEAQSMRREAMMALAYCDTTAGGASWGSIRHDGAISTGYVPALDGVIAEDDDFKHDQEG